MRYKWLKCGAHTSRNDMNTRETDMDDSEN